MRAEASVRANTSSTDIADLQSLLGIAAAQEAGRFDDEIVPMQVTMAVKDKETGEISMREVTVDRDECNRPNTTLEGLAALQPVRAPGNFVTAGNASQLSDGAAAVVLMDSTEAEKQGIEPMGAFKGFAVAGCEPDEMGIGPVFAVPRLLERHGLKVDDIDIWELNEAFASQALYCRDRLGIDDEKCNVNGGSIAIGHPFGMTGARMTGHLMREGKLINVAMTLNASASTRLRGTDLDARLAGVVLSDLSDSQRRPGLSGSVAKSVERSSRAYASGLRPGDVIVGVNQRDIEDTGELADLLQRTPRQLLLTVVRGQSVFYLLLK